VIAFWKSLKDSEKLILTDVIKVFAGVAAAPISIYVAIHIHDPNQIVPNGYGWWIGYCFFALLSLLAFVSQIFQRLISAKTKENQPSLRFQLCILSAFTIFLTLAFIQVQDKIFAPIRNDLNIYDKLRMPDKVQSALRESIGKDDAEIKRLDQEIAALQAQLADFNNRPSVKSQKSTP
jgi:uncharacterized membrane protein